MTISIYRKGVDEIRDVAIVRAIIKVNPVKFELLEEEYVYNYLLRNNNKCS